MPVRNRLESLSAIVGMLHRSLAYNNGIVAMVDELDVADLGGGLSGIGAVRGLQIVNGGQTTASLHRARREDKALRMNAASD
jgi:hypothetical protein